MDKLKQWVALTVVAALAIVAAGWFLLISPKRSEAAELRSQTATQQSANGALKTKIEVLRAQAKALPQKQAKLAAVAAKIPDNPALPSLIRALTVAADDTNVELLSVAPAQPVVVAAAAAPAAGTAGAAPAAGSAGVLQAITLNLGVVGGYFQIEQFMDRLESLSRAFKVSGLTLSPGDNPLRPAAPGAVAPVRADTLRATVAGSVYMATGRTTAAAPTGK